MKFSECTAKSSHEVFKMLRASESGLSEKESEERLKIYGANEIKEKETGIIDIILRQLKSPFFYLLFAAVIITLLIGQRIEGVLILFFILINILLGFYQEFRAEKSVLLLKKYIPAKTRVKRQGKEETIAKNLLVPGDIVLLEAGDIVPADLRVLKLENFLIDESVLTGESVPNQKSIESLLKEVKQIFEAKNILFAGTAVISGEAEGIVIGTGRQTFFGEITKLVSGITRESAYEKDLLRFSRLILRTVIVSIIFVFLANLIIKGTANFFEFLIFCVALIVSIIPEALPLVVTVSLSKGALKLAREKVVVKRLSAIEDLGNIEILCTDKTGTLTENRLSVEKITASNKEKCLLYGLLGSSYVKQEIESTLNPFDLALFEKADKKIQQSLRKVTSVSEIPFDSLRLRNSVIVKDENGNLILIVKGAPETILKLCSKFEQGNGKEIGKETEREGKEGKRILAVAYKNVTETNLSDEVEKDLTFLGYFSFSDPLKKTAKDTIRLAGKLGVRIKILTGDSKEVAGFIAKEIGLIKDAEEVVLASNLDSLSCEDFEKTCDTFSVFARVSPQTKYKIVEALQKKYEVGFLGEGINDAPALKIANLAIAVKGAADVAREASDIVLLKKDLKIIIDGIFQGRNIFSNINKYIKCVLASNFGNFYSIAVISLFISFLPMLPVQILLGNILSDFPLIIIATDKVDVEELKKPKLYQLNRVIVLIILLALVSTIFDFIFFGIFHKTQPATLQTLWFIESILTEILLIFSIRTKHFFLRAKKPSLALIFLTLLDAIIIISLPFTNFGKNFLHFTSPSLFFILIVLSLVFSYFLVSEIVKLIYFKYRKIK
jgi:Mg2+-importing ATPase